MATASIKLRDLANGRISVKLEIDPRYVESPASRVAQEFFDWLQSRESKQSQPAADAATMKGR
jgi:hypothetical protein